MMASNDGRSDDFYSVLGLKKECTLPELKIAYKKLAMRWHPDRCSASGNSKYVEEAKKKFQAIQQAYSVLSDSNKRFMYDVGVYESDDDDENGMGDFLNEMADMMSRTKPSENAEGSFVELQELFNEMFQADVGTFGSSSQTVNTATCSTSSYVSYCGNSNSSNKRNSSGMTNSDDPSTFDSHFQNYGSGTGGKPTRVCEGEGNKRRNCRRNQR